MNEEERKKDEMNFFNQKVGFIAGIIVIITILNDIVNIFIGNTYQLKLVEFLVCSILAFGILVTSKFNSLLNKEGVKRFGEFLTIASILLFLLEIVLIGNPNKTDKESVVIFIVIAIGIIIAVIYLSFFEYLNQNKKFNKTEKFREISYQVGIEAEKNMGNPYQIAYEKVNDFVNNDYAKLMWLKAEANLPSYDTIINAALKIGLALVTVLTFFWNVMSKYNEYNNGMFILQMIYIGSVIFAFCIVIFARNKYKYNGIGDKYVKQAIDNLEKDMVQNKNVNK